MSAIQVGIDGTVVPITDPNAVRAAFQAAVDRIPASGGELYVLPPASAGVKYRFDGTVVVRTPNVLIRFASGVTLDFAATNPPNSLFEVAAPNFRCVRAAVRHTIAEGSTGRSFFRVRDTAFVGQTNDARFEDCHFDVELSTAVDVSVLGFSCIRAGGLASPGRHGLQVIGCTFVLRPGTAQGTAWSSSGEPFGVCGLRVDASGHSVVVGNSFRSQDPVEPGESGPAMLFHDAPECVIAGNIVRQLRLPASSPVADEQASVAVRLRRSDPPAGFEGHHAILSGNLFEQLRCDYAVALDTAFYDGLAGNDFGGADDQAGAAVRASGSPLVFVGNGFHDFEPGPGTSFPGVVELQGAGDVELAGNTFADLDPGSRPVLVTASSRNLHAQPAQTRALSTP